MSLLGEHLRFGAPGGVERRLGWVLSMAGLAQMLALTWPASSSASQHPLWWNVLGLIVAALVVLLAVSGLVLPTRILVVAWTAVPVGLAILGLTAFAPRDGIVPVNGNPWPWTLDPMAFGYLTLIVSRPLWAFIGPVVLPLLPAASALFFVGEVPQELASLIPTQMGGLVYTVIFLMLRDRLRRLRGYQQRARVADQERVRAEAELQRRSEFSGLVHDNVLSILNAAIALRGTPSDALRAEAGVALDLLGRVERAADSGGTGVVAAVLASRLDAAWRRIDPACPIAIDVGSGEIPPLVADAVEHASCEALRNSLHHAGAEVTRAVDARLCGDTVEVHVSDDGPGFEVSAVPEARLGVRDSILGRVHGVGGEAAIDSRVGGGTKVSIRWPG